MVFPSEPDLEIISLPLIVVVLSTSLNVVNPPSLIVTSPLAKLALPLALIDKS